MSAGWAQSVGVQLLKVFSMVTSCAVKSLQHAMKLVKRVIEKGFIK